MDKFSQGSGTFRGQNKATHEAIEMVPQSRPRKCLESDTFTGPNTIFEPHELWPNQGNIVASCESISGWTSRLGDAITLAVRRVARAGDSSTVRSGLPRSRLPRTGNVGP
jgi:hypothetical protein